MKASYPMDALKMDTLKQEQKLPLPEDTDSIYTWSTIRVGEGVTTNVVSFLIISLLAVFGGVIYAAWLLILSVLHAPTGLIGILAFILLGAVLMLIILCFVIAATIRGVSSAAFAGAIIGAVVGGAIGAAVDKEKRQQRQKVGNP